jgi:hypothetical protein
MAEKFHVFSMIFIRLAFLFGIGYSVFFSKDIETAILVTLGLGLSFLPTIIERSFNVDLPQSYEFVIVAFIFASMFLGEFGDAYERFWWWDNLLHASSGVILGYVGFMILFILNMMGRINVGAAVIAFFTFSVGMASAGLWEIFEFMVDRFGTRMQLSLRDTMIDMILAAFGSLLAAGFAYWHYRWPQNSPMKNAIQNFKRLNRNLKQKNSAP